MSLIRVILCDDHAVVRRGIRDTISEAVDIQVVGEAGSYAELREVLRRVECDVLVLDLNMPGRSGLDALTTLKEEGSSVKTLVVSMYPEDQYAIRCLRAGARGYLNKAGDPGEMVAAIRTVMQGRKYVTPEWTSSTPPRPKSCTPACRSASCRRCRKSPLARSSPTSPMS